MVHFRQASGSPAFSWVDEQPTMFDSQAGLEGAQGPLLLCLESLSMQQLTQLLYVPATEQVFTLHPPPEELKRMSASQRLGLSKFLGSFLRGPVPVRSEEEEFFVHALQRFLVQDEGGAFTLSPVGQALFKSARVVVRAQSARVSSFTHEENSEKTRWELVGKLQQEGWISQMVFPRRRKQIKENPYRCDAELDKHFFLEPQELPFTEYLLALLQCAVGRSLESQTVPHLQSQRYYGALLEGKDPITATATKRRRVDAETSAGLDLLADAPARMLEPRDMSYN